MDEKSDTGNFHGKARQLQLGISKFLAKQGYLELALEIADKTAKKHYSEQPQRGLGICERDLFEEPIFDIEATFEAIKQARLLYKNTFGNT